ILREAYQQGLLDGVTWLLSEGLQSDQLAATVGQTADGKFIIEGLRGTRPKAVGPAYEAFADAYAAAYGSQPTGPYDAHTYDAAIIAVLATEAAGEANGAAVRDHVVAVSAPPGEPCTSVAQCLELLRNGQEIDYEGASGSVNMDEVGDVLADYEIWEVQADGTTKVVGDVTTQ
ncbi:MAG TPA: ABC transporter substrate-binding protein, partial [Bacillota bacterium]